MNTWNDILFFSHSKMSEDNNENLYYYSNKGKQQTFNLDDLTTEELKKFEKMTERQRLKFITNFELQRDAPFQDAISLKPIMTEARNEKYGDYALLKAKLDEIDSIVNKDPNIAAKLNEYQVMTPDGQKINEYFLPFFRNITEEDLKNCMKAFDMKNVSLGMLKKYYTRKIESLDMPGVKTSFLDTLKKFYEKVLKLDPPKDDKAATLSLETNISKTTPEELNAKNVEKYIKDCQELIKKTVKEVVKEAELDSSEKKKIIKYLDPFELEKIQTELTKLANEQLNTLIKFYMQIESNGVDIITGTPSEEHKEKEVSEKPEALEETKEEPSIATVEEEVKETEEKPEETETETETTPGVERLSKNAEEVNQDLNTPSKIANTETERQMIARLDHQLPRLNAVINSFKKKNDAPDITGLIKQGKQEGFGPKVYTYSEPINMSTKYIIRKSGDDIMVMTDRGDFMRHNLKDGWKVIGALTEPLNKDSSATWKIEYHPNLKKASYVDPNHTHEITYTKYGKGYKVKYTSGSIIDKIRSKFLKNVEKSIDDLEKTDKNIYSKLDALESQIRELKDSLKNMENSKKEKEITIPPPPPPIPKPLEPEFKKPKTIFDEIKHPVNPLKPVDKNWKIEKPQEEYSDIKKILDERRKDIEYSDDDDEYVEWGEGYSKKMKRMEILDFLKSLEN